jgi:hypothetical protein
MNPTPSAGVRQLRIPKPGLQFFCSRSAPDLKYIANAILFACGRPANK